MRIYERHPMLDAYRVGGSFTPYAIIATDKRFSDAELAAETYKGEAEFRATAGYGYDYSIIKECDRKRSDPVRAFAEVAAGVGHSA